MSEFLHAIPAAATSPYAIVAYALCGVLFLLAGAKLRTVQAVLRQISEVPAKDRRQVIESVTGAVIPKEIAADQWIRNNRNKWIFLLLGSTAILLTTLAVVSLSRIPGKLDPPPPPEEANAAVEAFLELMDRREYSLAYSSMGNAFQETYELEQWLSMSAMHRAPLGTVKSRSTSTYQAGEQVFGNRPYHLRTFVFQTRFSGSKPLYLETVTVASTGIPDPWRVSAYFLGSPPDQVATE